MTHVIRKRVRHYDIPNHAHELTFSSYGRRRVLLKPGVPETVLAAIERIRERAMVRVLAFVVMPEHMHLLVVPCVREGGDPVPVASILGAVKRPSSYRVKQAWQQSDPDLVGSMTIRERPGKTAFRFWQEGGGYDRNLTSSDAIRSSIAYIHRNPLRRGVLRGVGLGVVELEAMARWLG